MADTAARVNMTVYNNASWTDAFQFGVSGDTSWSFTGCSFHMDVKGSKDDASALLSLTTANSRIVVDDVVQRILNLNVTESVLAAALVPGEYVYDLVMIDGSSVRTVLQKGEVCVKQGVTQA